MPYEFPLNLYSMRILSKWSSYIIADLITRKEELKNQNIRLNFQLKVLSCLQIILLKE